MSLNDLKAAFSTAYVRAMTHAAGYFTQDPNRDRDGDGVDLEIFSRDIHGTIRSPSLHLQLKATADTLTGDPFPFDIEVKNYDELRSTSLQVPRILVVVNVPKNQTDWSKCSPRQLVLKRCAYWLSLRGEPPTTNTSTIRVSLPRAQMLDAAAIDAIMQRIRAGGFP
jgi:hypothetical protein